MKIKQISIFVENKTGRLRHALETLASANINVRALSVADNEKSGIIRIIVDDTEKAKEVLTSSKFIIKETEVIVIEVPDEPNELNNILTILEDNDINIEYIYALLSQKHAEAIIVMKINKPEEGLELLNKNNIRILKKEDIENI